MKEKPIGIAIMICDHMITEEGSRKKSLIGTFNNLYSRNFPCVHPKLHVYIALTNGNGPSKLKLRCVNEDDPQLPPLFELEGGVKFSDPTAVIEAGFNLANLVFPKPGLHSIELLCDDELILQRRLNVSVLNPPKKEAGSE